MEWKIGQTKITLVQDVANTQFPANGLYTNFDADVLAKNLRWIEPRYGSADGMLGFSVHALIVESQGLRIMMDPCWGDRQYSTPEYSNLGGAFLDRLAAAGFQVEDIDMVVCTHLHGDHVGWNTRLVDGVWVPTFPNARYVFGRVEFDFWEREGEGTEYSAPSEAIRPLVDAGLVNFVETEHRMNSELELFPSPGHTPGHMSLRIHSGGEEAIITGDMMHNPIQIAAPEFRMFLDADPDQAVQTRTEFIARHRDSGVRIFGTHFPEPASGFIESWGSSVRFVD